MSFDLPLDLPLSHMLKCKKSDLQAHQLRKLSEAKNLRKRVLALLEDWVAAEANAMLCEMVLTERAVMAQLAIPFPQEGSQQLERPDANRNAAFNARKRGYRKFGPVVAKDSVKFRKGEAVLRAVGE